MTKNQKQEKGITLIALIITIIILLILAGITISAITSSGLFGKAKKAEIETYHSIVKEQIILGTNEYQIEKAGGYSGTVIEYLESESYIATVDSESYYRVQIEEVAENVKTGKGATKVAGDIYVIEDNTSDASTKEYVLRYYDKTGQYIDLLYIGADGTTTDPNPNLGDGGNEDIVTEPEIPDYPTTKEINYIEDLIDVAMDVNNGTNDYTEQTIELKRDLDFTNKEHYRDPDHYYSYNNNKTDYYSLDTLTKVTTSGGTDVSSADTTNDSYPPSASAFQELNASIPPAPGFTQIGDSSENTFKGVFNGNGYTISNMYMGSSKTYYGSRTTNRESIGLFGYNDGYIYNFKLSNTSIAMNSSVKVGLLTTENRNVIKDCIVGTVSISYNKVPEYATMSSINTGTIYNASVEGTFTCATPIDVFGCIVITNNGAIYNANITGTATFTYRPNSFAGIASTNNNIIAKCNVTANYTFPSETSMALIAINNNENAKVIDCNLGNAERRLFSFKF